MKKEKDMDSKIAEYMKGMAYVLDDSHTMSREEMEKLEADPEFQRLEKEVDEELKKAGLL